MSERYTVLQSRVWRAANGRTASIYGALPWWGGEAVRIRDGWEMVDVGWTIADRDTNTVGCCREPWSTREAAQAVADEWNAADTARRASHAREWAPVLKPVEWTVAVGNDGARRHHSGERWSIRCEAGRYHVEQDGADYGIFPFSSLAKAKAWCERIIRSDRQQRTFAAA